jgi:hypothetical protein
MICLVALYALASTFHFILYFYSNFRIYVLSIYTEVYSVHMNLTAKVTKQKIKDFSQHPHCSAHSKFQRSQGNMNPRMQYVELSL